jgi:hypothetical protein
MTKLAVLNQGDGGASNEHVFCLRQSESQLFWDGAGWVHNLVAARMFSDLDHALSTARRMGQSALDLLILFPTRKRSLSIPLARALRNRA